MSRDERMGTPMRADGEDPVEMLDLGESPVRRGLEVPGTVVGTGPSRRRRPEPTVVMVAAIALVMVGLLGSGPNVSGPVSSPSANPLVLGSPGPSPSPDRCPDVGLPPPKVRLSTRADFGYFSESTMSVSSLARVGFTPPVDRSFSTPAGSRTQLTLSDARCSEALRIDLHRVAGPADEVFALADTKPMEGGRVIAFDAPPGADWVMRVALRLRGPTFSEAPWTIYFIRLNTGGPWEAPVPSDVQGGGEPAVTPAVACGQPDATSWTPPAVELVLAGARRVPGVLGGYRWAGRTSAAGTPEFAAIPPLELAFGDRVTFRIEDDVCALAWRIETAPAERPRWDAAPWVWTEWSGSPLDPKIAAQNAFVVDAVGFGDVIVRARFDLSPTSHEFVYWLVRFPEIEVPDAFVGAERDGLPSGLARSCGIWAQVLATGAGGGETCSPPEGGLPDDLPTLEVPADSTLYVEVPGRQIQAWGSSYAGYTGAVSEEHSLVWGGGDAGRQKIPLPVPPPGDWLVRIMLTFRTETYELNVPYVVRVVVAG